MMNQEILQECFWQTSLKGINSFEYLEEITTINEQYVEQILNEVFNENKMILSVIKK